jgi:hypothetical protein
MAPASAGIEPGPKAGADNAPGPRADDADAERLVREILASQLEGLAEARESVAVTKEVVESAREQLRSSTRLRKLIERSREKFHDPADLLKMTVLDKECAAAEANEQAAREEVRFRERMLDAETAEVEQCEAKVESTRILLRPVDDPKRDEALDAAETRLSRAILKTASAREKAAEAGVKAAEAGVKAAEAKLTAAKKKLEATRAEIRRVRAEEVREEALTRNSRR